MWVIQSKQVWHVHICDPVMSEALDLGNSGVLSCWRSLFSLKPSFQTLKFSTPVSHLSLLLHAHPSLIALLSPSVFVYQPLSHLPDHLCRSPDTVVQSCPCICKPACYLPPVFKSCLCQFGFVILVLPVSKLLTASLFIDQRSALNSTWSAGVSAFGSSSLFPRTEHQYRGLWNT